jgi:hypothetical protein
VTPGIEEGAGDLQRGADRFLQHQDLRLTLGGGDQGVQSRLETDDLAGGITAEAAEIVRGSMLDPVPHVTSPQPL